MTSSSHSAIRALIVDDEPQLRRVLTLTLRTNGFLVSEASNGVETLTAVRLGSCDLILLDVQMPGMNGLETCRRIREIDPRVGILIVSVCNSEHDRLGAFESGADDYVTKPYDIRELVARMRAVHRRTTTPNSNPSPRLIRAGALELDERANTLKKNGSVVHLSPTEFALIAVLMQNEGVCLSHAKLLRSVWGPEYGGELEYLRSYIKMLRKKIEVDPAKPKYILTQPWTGYRFCNPLNSLELHEK